MMDSLRQIPAKAAGENYIMYREDELEEHFPEVVVIIWFTRSWWMCVPSRFSLNSLETPLMQLLRLLNLLLSKIISTNTKITSFSSYLRSKELVAEEDPQAPNASYVATIL